MANSSSKVVDPQTLVLLRQTRHWTQEELAVASGLGLRTIQRAESDGQLSSASLKSLASVFEVTVDELLLASPSSGSSVSWGPQIGLAFGMGGAVLGGMLSMSSQVRSLSVAESSSGSLSLGFTGLFVGLTCALIGWLYNRHTSKLADEEPL